MAHFPWHTFLTQWAKEDTGVNVTAHFIGADEKDIQAHEMRLHTTFPPSYREFLTCTNGWTQPNILPLPLSPLAAIDRFAQRYTDVFNPWIEGVQYMKNLYGANLVVSDEDYFVYGNQQEPTTFREEYLATTFAISENIGTAFYLLNPHIVTADGEWEAWFFDLEIGAIRYRSFWELMQAEYQNFLMLKEST